jgi:hypothetical protein
LELVLAAGVLRREQGAVVAAGLGRDPMGFLLQTIPPLITVLMVLVLAIACRFTMALVLILILLVQALRPYLLQEFSLLRGRLTQDLEAARYLVFIQAVKPRLGEQAV